MGGREQSMANSENEKKPEKIKQTETRIHMLTMNEKKNQRATNTSWAHYYNRFILDSMCNIDSRNRV